MMDRRAFVKFLALMAAGAAAKPEQIAAYEHYYDVNTPATDGPFIAVDEVMLGGTARLSTVVQVRILSQSTNTLNLAINAFGGIFRWHAAPDQKIITDELSWHIEYDPNDIAINKILNGHISYITQAGIRKYMPLTKAHGIIYGEEDRNV